MATKKNTRTGRYSRIALVGRMYRNQDGELSVSATTAAPRSANEGLPPLTAGKLHRNPQNLTTDNSSHHWTSVFLRHGRRTGHSDENAAAGFPANASTTFLTAAAFALLLPLLLFPERHRPHRYPALSQERTQRGGKTPRGGELVITRRGM